jgi:hypothetical protein
MKNSKPKANRKQPARQRPKLLPISEEMRRWSALLESELLSWRGVISKSMFGFRGVYRGKRIFAALPRSRGFGSSPSILLKFRTMPPALLHRAESDTRLHSNSPGKRWFSFTLSSDSDLHDALEWLNYSYESAKGGSKR